MDFAELSYWLDALTEYERMCVERGGGEEIVSSNCSDYREMREVSNQARR